MDSLKADLRYACRRLSASPGFVLIAVASIALGVGASTAVFSAVQSILFAGLPYSDADRIVGLADRDAEGGRLPLTYGTYAEIAARGHSFERLAVADRWQPALNSNGDPERLDGDRVSADYFRVFGVSPAVGRDFDAADDAPGGPRVAIISASLAQRRFGGATEIVNREIVLNGAVYTIIGVLPAGFRDALSPGAEVFAPLQYRDRAEFQSTEWGHHLHGVGRLVTGVTPEQAAAETASIGRTPLADFPRPVWAPLGNGLLVEPLLESLTYAVRPLLLSILGAVVLLLAIACVNVSNLLLARALARRAELAVRTALGAGRHRLTRQLVTESVLVALLGGLAGLGVATVLVHALVALAPATIQLGSFGPDASMFASAFAITAVVGLAMGVMPASHGVHENLYAAVRSGSRTTDARHRLLRRGLVVAQVALAFVLLTGAGLLLRSVDRLLATSPGFAPSHVLTLQVVGTGRSYASSAELARFYQGAVDAVRALPGVDAVALTTQLPLSGDDESYGVLFETDPRANGTAHAALRYVVTPGWFDTMGIRLVRGRLLGAEDRPNVAPSVLINESFAKRHFGSGNPIGQRLKMGPFISQPDGPWATVVGVVGDVKQTSLALDAPDAVYFAMGQWVWVDAVQWLAVRTMGDPSGLTPAIERAVWSVDPTPPVVRVATMTDLVERSEAQRRFALVIFAGFGIAAVVLAAVGLYGVVAGSVEERTREIGVRAALGASPARVGALIVRQGMTLVIVGALVGAALAAVGTRGLASLLFGVAPLDVWAYSATLALLVGMALLACSVPAARAARVDPAVTLRAD
ncbi:MAG TPA: ABC transporter permease [Steroidobacteraceae bacterium]|jgi:predicted permease|nr:ABC transporter permease [Steroidobacteraceae bacterium]